MTDHWQTLEDALIDKRRVIGDTPELDAALAFVRKQRAAPVQGQPLDAPAAVTIPSEVREAIESLRAFVVAHLAMYGGEDSGTQHYQRRVRTVRKWLDSLPAPTGLARTFTATVTK